MPQSHTNLLTVLCGCAGVLIGAACTADWLTDPVVSARLWPADVNAWIVELLGGTADLQLRQPELTASSVAVRFLGMTAVVMALVRLFHRGPLAAELTGQLLRRLFVVGVGCGVLWGIQPLLTNELALAVPTLQMLLCGAALFGLAGSCCHPSEESSPVSVRLAWLLVAVVTVMWICASFRLNERLYANLLIPHGDSAMYEEHLWNVWHGKGFRSFLDQGLFLGEHIQVIHLLLLPVHLVWPSHLMLELAEAVALGSCTIPLYLMVRRRTCNAWAASLLALSWLFFFPMHFLDIAIDQKTFRPVCLGLPFVLWMIHAAESGRFRLAWLCLLIALSAKEDMALITAPLAAVLAISGWRSGAASLRNWGIAAASLSTIWLILAVLVVIPAFRSGDVVHYSRYFGELGSTPRELVHTAVHEPTRVLAQMFSQRTLLYAVVLLAPTAFLAMRRPWPLTAGTLTFAMLSLLQLGNGVQGGGLPPVPYHHFHAPLLPVLFWATACGVSSIGTTRGSTSPVLPSSPPAAALLVFCCCVTTGFTGSLLPYGASFWSNSSPVGRHALYYPREDTAAGRHLIMRAKMADAVVAKIPLTARVASTDFIHTRLTHCERSYDYSDYERAVNEEGRRVPADCSLIVIDTGHRYSAIRSPADIPELQESSDWRLWPDETGGRFLILERRRNSSQSSGNTVD